MGCKNEVIKNILDIEWDMFQTIPVESKAACQESSKESFLWVRESMFITWSADTLNSYYDDLVKTKDAGENVMTDKYALIDNLILPLSYNPFIDEIVKIEEKWQEELAGKYPAVFAAGRTLDPSGSQGAGSVPFDVYRGSELQTYSDLTLDYLFRDISNALREGKNLSEQTYTQIYKAMGFSSLAEAEERLKGKLQKET